MVIDALLTPTLAAIHERRAVRSYSATPVEHDTIERLLEAAVRAPSSMNTQPWSFVVVQDPVLLGRFEREAADVFMREPPVGELAAVPSEQLDVLRSLIRSPGFGIFHGAPALIVIYSASAEGIPDCFLAAENLMLTAVTHGLGTCPIGLARPFLDLPEIKAELNVPATARCAMAVVVGEPVGEAEPTHRDAPRPTTNRELAMIAPTSGDAWCLEDSKPTPRAA